MEDGHIVEGVQPIQNVVFSHFKNHYTAQHKIEPVVDNMPFKTLSYVDGGGLIKLLSADKAKAVVWDCDSYKSPRPEGVNFGFIKELWQILKEDIMHFIPEFHQNGKLARGINTTFIALIPKVDTPHKLNDFRPISLVGCLYKILAKVLANRLIMVVGKVISETQTTFVKVRQILDRVFTANEVVDEARK